MSCRLSYAQDLTELVRQWKSVHDEVRADTLAGEEADSSGVNEGEDEEFDFDRRLLIVFGSGPFATNVTESYMKGEGAIRSAVVRINDTTGTDFFDVRSLGRFSHLLLIGDEKPPVDDLVRVIGKVPKLDNEIGRMSLRFDGGGEYQDDDLGRLLRELRRSQNLDTAVDLLSPDGDKYLYSLDSFEQVTKQRRSSSEEGPASVKYDSRYVVTFESMYEVRQVMEAIKAGTSVGKGLENTRAVVESAMALSNKHGGAEWVQVDRAAGVSYVRKSDDGSFAEIRQDAEIIVNDRTKISVVGHGQGTEEGFRTIGGLRGDELGSLLTGGGAIGFKIGPSVKEGSSISLVACKTAAATGDGSKLDLRLPVELRQGLGQEVAASISIAARTDDIAVDKFGRKHVFGTDGEAADKVILQPDGRYQLVKTVDGDREIVVEKTFDALGGDEDKGSRKRKRPDDDGREALPPNKPKRIKEASRNKKEATRFKEGQLVYEVRKRKADAVPFEEERPNKREKTEEEVKQLQEELHELTDLSEFNRMKDIGEIKSHRIEHELDGFTEADYVKVAKKRGVYEDGMSVEAMKAKLLGESPNQTTRRGLLREMEKVCRFNKDPFYEVREYVTVYVKKKKLSIEEMRKVLREEETPFDEKATKPELLRQLNEDSYKKEMDADDIFKREPLGTLLFTHYLSKWNT